MTIDLRLALPAVGAWVASAIVIGVPSAAVPVAIALWLLAALVAVAAVVMRGRQWLALTVLIAVAAGICCTSIALATPTRQPDALLAVADTGQRVTVTGSTTSTGTDHVALLVDSVEIDGAVVTGAIPMIEFGQPGESTFGIGTSVQVVGTVTRSEPGDDVAFLLFADAPAIVVAPPPWYLDWANGLRASFAATAQSLPGDGGDLLAGLAIGDTSAVSDELDAAMKASSLSHLTAVSGANCAVVIGLIMAAGAALGLPRGARVGASIIVLVAFVVLVTPEPSVLRAALMAVLVLLALLSGRPVRGVPVLALATLILLVLDPWLARNYGFALSVLATGGLLVLAGPIARALGRWMPTWLAIMIAVPLAAQLVCQPVIILLNASLPTYGVLANMLAEPAAPIATVIGLAACAATPVAPQLGVFLCQVAWLPSAWIAAVARFFANLPGARLPWPSGMLGVGLLALVSTLAVLALLGRERWRRSMAFCLAVVVICYTGLAGGSQLAVDLSRPSNWQIAACDVDQGDAIVMRSAGQIALFDAGPDPKLLTACLHELGVTRIDLFVLTHFHLDHYGGVSALAGMVDQAFVGPSAGPSDDRVVADIAAGGAHVQQVEAGLNGTLGDLHWRVLWPPHQLAGVELGNPSSITIEFQPVGACPNGCLSAIFLGDLTEDPQTRVLGTVQQPRFDVVKVAHHGSADQSEAFYDRLHATVGVISVGADNDYGHPASSLLGILERAGTSAERTDERGMILLAPGDTPGTVKVWTEH
ncbi:MAG: MBL fold metallo-hydrolase [Salinibacterium sp.]|nr:MAG: MBL fold metallo-hydrolase [Salinibacterium sp.]